MPSQGKGNRLDASEMMMRLALPCIVFTLMFICANNVANAAADWCYNDPHCDPKTWAGECQTGKQQSPIDFNDKNTKKYAGPPIRLRFNKQFTDVHNNFLIKNNGHTIQVQLQKELTSELIFDGDFMKGTYTFAQLHFHWGSHIDTGSEHTVNGNGYVAELHLVHYSNDYKSLVDAVASKNRRGLAVLGIFFEISNQDNYALNPIIDAIIKVDNPTDTLTPVMVPLNMSALLPDEMALWRYYGSLTTPSCNEVVHWTVFKKAMPILERQWKHFLASKGANKHILEDNNRPPQPTINRKSQLFEHVIRDRIPEQGVDRNPPADDTFFESAQKDISNRSPAGDNTERPNNGANSSYGNIVDSAITGFLFISLILQIVLSSILRCL